MFHSRNPIYRNPTGAVQAHTNIHFKLLVPENSDAVRHALWLGKNLQNK